MGDTVTTQTMIHLVLSLYNKTTNFSDGTGETLVKKIDASEVTFMTKTQIERYPEYGTLLIHQTQSLV